MVPPLLLLNALHTFSVVQTSPAWQAADSVKNADVAATIHACGHIDLNPTAGAVRSTQGYSQLGHRRTHWEKLRLGKSKPFGTSKYNTVMLSHSR